MSGDWGDGERKTLSRNLGVFNTEEGLVDAFTTGLSESMASGPTASIYRFLKDSTQVDNLTGAEANAKYNLVGTPIAYKDDEKVSDYAASAANERFADKMLADATYENIDTFGKGVANFAGSLAGGFLDPVNVAVGGGTAAMAKSAMGTIGTRLALTRAITNNPWKSSIVQNTVDNLASSVVTDMVAIPLGESVTREKVTHYQRAMNIAGGVMFGTALGTALDVRSLGKARKVVDDAVSSSGSDAPDIIVEANAHAAMNVENNKIPNQDFEPQKHDISVTSTRPEQTPYKQEVITTDTLSNTDFFVAKKNGADEVSQVGNGGTTGYVVTDNANLASNQVTPLDGSSVGEMTRVTVDPKAKIVTQDVFDDVEVRAGIAKGVIESVKRNADSINLEKMGPELEEMINNADDMNLVLDELDNFFDSFDSVPSAHDLVNSALKDQGFDGYTGSTKSYQEGNASNTLVVFDKKNIIEGETSPTQKFDPEHPKSAELKEKLDAHNKAEADRLNSYKSDLDYDAKAVESADSLEPEMYEVDDNIDNLLESFGLDKDNFDDVGFSEKEIAKIEGLKNANAHEDMSKALLECIIKGS